MATVRIATHEVQVNDMIYVFGSADQADAFEACVATVDLSHCERDYAPIAKRTAEVPSNVSPSRTPEQAENGSI